ncbi:MAG: DUF502 domain-containing protein [Calditrichaeota bacterium]|nr:MAG: DUF502 domain-containing protein [Calditrichota bacterium]
MFLNKLITILKRHFVSGVLVVVPIILTYLVIKFLFETVDNILQPLIVRLFGYSLPGLGLITTLLLIILAGIFTRNIIGKKFFKLGDFFLHKMPIIRPIYSAAKQLLEALTVSNIKSFKEVVLVEYPRKNCYALGFLSNRIEIESKGERVAVFVPSTPTPVSGMVVLVAPEEILHINMSVEEGVKFLVSGGVVSPEFMKKRVVEKDEIKEVPN